MTISQDMLQFSCEVQNIIKILFNLYKFHTQKENSIENTPVFFWQGMNLQSYET